MWSHAIHPCPSADEDPQPLHRPPGPSHVAAVYLCKDYLQDFLAKLFGPSNLNAAQLSLNICVGAEYDRHPAVTRAFFADVG
ncbi:hypothetical protein PENFLA_c005G10645 [Penicillium flavigenum]|uniref:Uncharacterized protein n=1 Tax=Penicillium flavigenum TaxID=254877 RepID=A0A1V6TQD9_9EURO|nr:hypothetical protein PENFLA_c005G10645 [Penicillium flavigenum]